MSKKENIEEVVENVEEVEVQTVFNEDGLDVLCTEDAQTTWSQGDMRLTTLVSGVQTVLECAKERSGKIAGVDICGEADAEAVHENEANEYANEKLLEVSEGLFGKSDCE